MALRFFLRTVARKILSLSFRPSYMHGYAIDADPAKRWRRSFTSVSRNVLSRITFTAATLAVLRGGLDHVVSSRSANTAPTRLAMRGSFLRRRIANKISGLSIRLSHLHRFAIDADPARLAIFLMRERFLL